MTREYRQRGGKRVPSGLSRQEYITRYREENKELAKEKAKNYIYPDRPDNPAKYLCNGLRNKAKYRGIPFNLEESDLIIPSHCPVLGFPIQRNIGGKSNRFNSISVDRIIPEFGYVKNNIQIMSQRANVMKNDASLEELERFALWVLNELIPSSKTLKQRLLMESPTLIHP